MYNCLQACSKVVKFITSITLSIHCSLDGKNVDIVFADLGTRLHRVVFDHLLGFQYNSLGLFLSWTKFYCFLLIRHDSYKSDIVCFNMFNDKRLL